MDWIIWTPIITLLLGFTLGFVADIVKSKIQLSNTYKEMIFRKRLDEIEEILGVIRELNFDCMRDDGREYPILLASHSNIRDFHLSIAMLLKTSCSFWISNEIRVALQNLNQYIFFVSQGTSKLDDIEMKEIGVQIRQDFKNFFFAISNLIKEFISSIPKDKTFELKNEEIQLNGIFDFKNNSIYYQRFLKKN